MTGVTGASHLSLIPAQELHVKSWGDHGELHRIVMAMFSSADLPGELNEKRLSRNILFRVDDTAQGKVLLVRSDIAPTNLPARARTKRESDSLLAVGTHVRFRMTVNAVRRNRPANPTIKRGSGVSPVDRLAEWVAQRIDAAIGDITVLNHDRTVVTTGRSALQLDLIDGYGVIVDSDVLGELHRTGIGRAKAFGCGLLTTARA